MDGVLPPPGAAGRERASFWNAVSEATEEPAALCAALFSCTLGYNDRLTQRAVEGALRRLLAREDAVAPILHGLCAAAARGTGGKQQAALLLRWSAHLAPRVEAASASFDKLARAQSSLLATLATGSARANRQRLPFAQLLRRAPSLAAAYVDYLRRQAEQPTLDACALASTLAQHCQRAPVADELRSACQAAALDLYIKVVLGATAAPPASAAASFAGVLAAATTQQFDELLQPALLRALRRSPDAAAAVTADLTEALTADLGASFDALLPLLLQLARSAKDDTRSAAARALAAVVQRSKGLGSACEAACAAAQALLGGSEGRLKEVHQRTGLLTALARLAAAPDDAAQAGRAVTFLAGFVKEETQDDARLAAFSALAAWLPASAGLFADAAQFFSAGLKDKEPFRRAHLRVLLAATGEQVAQLPAPVASQLADTARGAVTKVAQRWEGLAALCVLARKAGADDAVAATLDDAKFWQAVLDGSAPLLRAAAIAKMCPEDAAVGSDLAACLLTTHAHRLKALPTALPTMARLLTLLALQPVKPVAARALAALERVVQAGDAAVNEALVSAASDWLSQQETSGGLYSQGDSEDAVVALPGAVGAVLLRLASAAAAPPAGALLLLAHRRGSRGGRGGASRRARNLAFWRLVVAKLAAASPGGAFDCAANEADICAVLLGQEGICCERPAERAAALAAVSTVAAWAPTLAFGQLLSSVLALADAAEHNTFTANDFNVFFTPEGQLSTDPAKATFVAPVSVSDTRRKARGRFKMYDDDDDEESQPPKPAATKPAAASKPAKDEKKDPRELARLEKLKEESALRARMAVVKTRLENALAGIAALADGNEMEAQVHLTALATPVMPLLASPLVGASAAFQAACCLVRCCAWPVRVSSGEFLVRALRTCLDLQTSAAAISSSPAVIRAVQHLEAACSDERALPAPTYRFCFPVLERILMLPQTSKLHTACFSVLALHTSSGVPVPHAETLKVLYHTREAGTAPAGTDTQALLCKCCAALSTEADVSAAAEGLLSSSKEVRAAALSALPCIPSLASALASPALLMRLFIAVHDSEEVVAQAAAELWQQHDLALPATYAADALPLLTRSARSVRSAAARAVAAAMALHPQTAPQTLAKLFAFYSDCYSSEGRAAAVEALKLASAALTPRDLPVVCTFLVRVLADEEEDVRTAAVAAGSALIDAHGSGNVAALLPIFDNYMSQDGHLATSRSATGGADETNRDFVRAGVVVLLGALAKHLDKEDPKVRNILDRLVDVLSTPSEAVQRSVSDCLPPLMASLSEDERRSLIQRLQTLLTTGARYGDRRGGAYGLAGVVKGLGISALKAYGVVDALKLAVEDKGSATAREGALMAFECLCTKLGRLFEPYVIHILPLLLSCFGDSNAGVREATEAAANAIMAQLSAQGVKLVLPGLMKGVEDSQWRTKQGSVQLLGSMAHCAPKQLTACLPTIVPRLAETLTDTHPKVAASARTALLGVGSVIRNPEIAALVPCIMDAIIDPNDKTNICLDTLLETTFVNSVDAPSLALMVPIITRGLRERKTDLKKKAAKIAGNMCSLVSSPADLAPYVPLLLPELKRALVDPIPEVRAIAAKAMASLLQGMGESHFTDLVPWLQQTLQSDASGVERSGAAQGLAEVLAVLGVPHVEALLPDVTSGCSSARPAVREGNLTLLRFLPATLGAAFEPFLPALLPCVLGGLSDEAEGVREASMGAGRTIVERYAKSALPLLLPAVEAGIGAPNWRIRQSSVELLGELLFKVSGATGKIQTTMGGEDESVSTEAQSRLLLEALGEQRKAEVLSAVYLARSDVGLTVRTAALHVWKSVVLNTPRTLGEILPVLMQRIIVALAASGADQRTGASRCLGELVRKLAERVLPTIVPILQQGLKHPDADTRQGVILGLSEVLNSATREQLASYYGMLIPTVQQALCDDSAAVRSAAGAAFNQMFRGSGGADASSEILPALLASLDGDLNALEGLKQVLKAQPKLLSSVLPRIATPPLTAFSAQTLGALAEVSGAALPPHLPLIMPPLLSACSSEDAGVAAAARTATEAVLQAVDESSMSDVVRELLRGLEDNSAGCRAATASLSGFYFRSTQDLEEHVPVILAALVTQLADPDAAAVQAAWAALGDITSALPKDNLHVYVRCVRDAVSSARDKARRRNRTKEADTLVAGFCLPKGLSPVLPIYLQAVLTGGGTEVREAAADAIGELVAVTSEESLKPHVITITGPLIRVISDKFQWQVKAAILQTLTLLITKGGQTLKPFVPQLQTTFVKCLQDAARTVRMRAAAALGLLMQLQTRVDPLCTELLNSLQAADDAGVSEALTVALRDVITQGGANITPPVLERIISTLQAEVPGQDEDSQVSRASALGAACTFATPAGFDALVGALSASGAGDARFRAAALCAVAERAAARVHASSTVNNAACSLAADGHADVRVLAVRCLGLLLNHQLAVGSAPAAGLVERISLSIADESSDVRRCALVVVKQAAKRSPAAFAPLLPLLLPAAAEALNDRVAPVKLAAERAVRAACFSTSDAGLEAAQAVVTGAGGSLRTKLTDVVLRRLSKLDDSDDEAH